MDSERDKAAFVHFSQAERSLYGVSLTKTYFSAAAIFATVTV